MHSVDYKTFIQSVSLSGYINIFCILQRADFHLILTKTDKKKLHRVLLLELATLQSVIGLKYDTVSIISHIFFNVKKSITVNLNSFVVIKTGPQLPLTSCLQCCLSNLNRTSHSVITHYFSRLNNLKCDCCEAKLIKLTSNKVNLYLSTRITSQ